MVSKMENLMVELVVPMVAKWVDSKADKSATMMVAKKTVLMASLGVAASVVEKVKLKAEVMVSSMAFQQVDGLA